MKTAQMEKTETRQTTLGNLGRSNLRTRLKTKDLTDVANPDHVIEIIELLNANPLATEEEFSKSTQPFNRSISLARNWGLLDGRELTNQARALIATESKRGRYCLLAILLQKSTVGKAFLEWSGDGVISNAHSSRVKEFLTRTIPDMKGSTRQQYARSLGKLITSLAPHHPGNRIIEDNEVGESESPIFIEGNPHFESRTIDVIDRLKPGTKTIRIPTGFMSAQGYDLVARNLEGAQVKILLGKDDKRGRRTLSDPLNSFRDSISGGIQSQGKKGSHRRLYKELVEGTSRVRKAQSRMIDTMHGKAYIGDTRWALHTSATLSRSGLEKNIETGLSTTNKEKVLYYVEKFEGYWEEAEDITAEIIEEIVESWIFEKQVDPYLAYLRGLWEVYGHLASRDIGKAYELASFQRLIVASTIRSLTDRSAALVISPTGTGKTVMGSYVMAAMKDRFDKKIVLIPNRDLKEKWYEDGLSFGIHPMIESHSKFQTDIDNFSDSKVGKNLHNYIDEKTLIIIDEAHKFRTENSQGHSIIKHILSGDFNGNKPGVLLLTATPIGTGFENLQNLYDLLNLGEGPKSAEELTEFPAFINVTLPFIMNRFGKRDGDGNKYLKFGSKQKYYADRRQMIALFDDNNEEIYQMIKDIDFRELKERKKGEISLDEFEIGIDPATVDHMTLSRIGLTNAVGSSSESACQTWIGNLLEKVDERNYLDPEKTRRQLIDLKNKIEAERSDEIYEKTLGILKAHSDKKIIVNVVHEGTREKLVRSLKKDTKRMVEQYVGTTKQKKNLREKFAPIANSVRIGKRDQIDILIASGGLSEGHDLQDADLIVNYDLWWTPLKLQQRMGRLDRPTDNHREFTVFHMVNINSKFHEIVTMDEKLKERSGELKDITADGAYEINSIREWKNLADEEGIVALSQSEDSELEDLNVTTSQHIEDLAEATQKDIDAALTIPFGFYSCSKGDNIGTFVMLKHNSEVFTGFRHQDDGMVTYAPGNQNYEKLLGYIRSEKGDDSKETPEDHQESVELLIRAICELHDLHEEEIQLIFSASIV